jgi:hypothetical protein
MQNAKRADRRSSCEIISVTCNGSVSALLQLQLPPQHARFVSFRLGLGNHSLFLIEDREAGVRQNVVGIDLRICWATSMASSKRLRSCSARLSPCSASVKLGSAARRLTVLFDRLLVMAFENQIERGVVMVFG